MQYVAWGFVGQTNIDPNAYVFVSGFGEFIGMFFFILLLVGILLNFNLSLSKAFKTHSFGWVVLAISLSLVVGLLIAFGVQYAIFTTHFNIKSEDVFYLTSLALNPALIIAFMMKGANFSSEFVQYYIPVGNGFIYLIMQFLGSVLGAYVAYVFFKRLIVKQEEPQKLQGCFFTQPSIKNMKANYFNEFLATFILVAAIICINFIFGANEQIQKIMIVSLVVAAIGYGLGGTTGYALNPFRDLGPRIVYWLVFSRKNEECKIDWKYAQVPILGPILGAIVATIILPGFLY